jgi:crossover junction endodeoxyribonuclease RuvC
MKILGIDPGSTSMGYAILEEKAGELSILEYGTSLVKSKELSEKLLQITELLESILKKHKPDVAGVEKLFLAKNKKTAFEVAHARGVIMLTLMRAHIQVHEITPNEVKIAVTNYGGSDKQMVAKMVAKILRVPSLAGDDNAADALAVAIATANIARIPY